MIRKTIAHNRAGRHYLLVNDSGCVYKKKLNDEGTDVLYAIYIDLTTRPDALTLKI